MALRPSMILRGKEILGMPYFTFRKQGLYIQDLINEDPEVGEAASRLPPSLRDDREWRIKRFADLSMKKGLALPEEQWTQPDEKKDYYLQPYLDDVRQEALDRLELYPQD
eukprot:CAMPEP_0201520192 /NCGR_PEP_ID=MMETSP0161_2-20130828/10553_1 /ASSEMBLY_ACC=CAM_ASM_000251 /TAXON_ID=180227 /ORGANISM="Neoparamoeba aestuarina, Strain SoJaBio B1-5/56/2" /LENGTH=109 /DNA_ID=CAMNT_0047918479 /DNA_START=104 /DNA_END=433 /DNA_ORIENTATION=+